MSSNEYKTPWYSREESNSTRKGHPKTNMETNELKYFLLKPKPIRTSDNMSSPFSKHYAMEIVIQSTECWQAKSLQLCLTLYNPWIVACWAPLSMGFPRQEYWSGLPFPTTGDLPHPQTESTSPAVPALQADSLPLSHRVIVFPKLCWAEKCPQRAQ